MLPLWFSYDKKSSRKFGGVSDLRESPIGVDEAAAILGCSVSWVYQNHDKPDGPKSLQRKKGRKLQFHASKLEAYLNGD
jgi:hypothetical protein